MSICPAGTSLLLLFSISQLVAVVCCRMSLQAAVVPVVHTVAVVVVVAVAGSGCVSVLSGPWKGGGGGAG